MLPFFVSVDLWSSVTSDAKQNGAIAKRLCNGLQIRPARFDSGSRLQGSSPANASWRGFFLEFLEFVSNFKQAAYLD